MLHFSLNFMLHYHAVYDTVIILFMLNRYVYMLVAKPINTNACTVSCGPGALAWIMKQ